MSQLGSAQLGRQYIGGSIDYTSLESAPSNITAETLDSLEPSTTMLGSTQVGAAILGAKITSIELESEPANTQAQTLDSETEVVTTTYGQSITTNAGEFNPVSLSPENLNISFNETTQEFESDWFTKDTPLEETGELVLVGSFRNERFDNVEIIVERDDSGNGQPDMRTDVHDLNDSNHVVTISESTQGDEIAEKGAKYRLRFPRYSQTDAISRLNLALGWNNKDNFDREWNLNSVSTKEDETAALIAVLISENYRLDATLDEVFKQQHIESATDSSLDFLSKEVGVTRSKSEQDKHLRKRVLSKSATRTFSTTGSDVTDLIGLIFDEEGEQISVGVLPDQPVLEVEVPQTVIDSHILTQAEIEELLNDGVASSYNVTITAI